MICSSALFSRSNAATASRWSSGKAEKSIGAAAGMAQRPARAQTGGQLALQRAAPLHLGRLAIASWLRRMVSSSGKSRRSRPAICSGPHAFDRNGRGRGRAAGAVRGLSGGDHVRRKKSPPAFPRGGPGPHLPFDGTGHVIFPLEGSGQSRSRRRPSSAPSRVILPHEGSAPEAPASGVILSSAGFRLGSVRARGVISAPSGGRRATASGAGAWRSSAP